VRLRFSVATLGAILHLILTLVTFGLWGFVWIGVVALAGEKRMSVGIDEWGNTNVQKALALTSVEQRKRKGSL